MVQAIIDDQLAQGGRSPEGAIVARAAELRLQDKSTSPCVSGNMNGSPC